jgi:glycosyltransferase involved in cell wall biosynthesis
MSHRLERKKPLRVLHIGKYFPPHRGGIETYLNDLMNVQHRQGLKVSGVVHTSEKRITDTSQSIDDLEGGAYTITRSARWFNVGYVPISPLFLLTLHKKVQAHRTDVIHVHLPNASALWLLFSLSARRIPWLMHWHADIVAPSSSCFVKLFYIAFRCFEKRLLKRAKGIFATSDAYLLDSRPLQAFLHKCHVIPLALDTKRLPPPDAVTPYKIKNHQRHQLLFVGRLSTYKGIRFLIASLQKLDDAHLWIAGDGEERKRIAAQVNDLKLTRRVMLLGEITDEEKWRLIKAADALVLPSVNKNEAFGVVLLEAGFYGLPLVTTQIRGSGVSWVASHFARHVQVKPGLTEELAVGIRQALNIPHRQPRPHVSSSVFNLETLSKQISEAYDVATGGKLTS